MSSSHSICSQQQQVRDDETDNGSSSTATTTNQSCLTVILQASPLVYTDNQGKRHPMDATNHDKEKAALEQALVDSTRHYCVLYKDGTLDELESSLVACSSSSRDVIMHISCHGQPGYLAFENLGSMQKIYMAQIKALIQDARNVPLKLIFLSACDSKPLGMELVKEIPHVICCDGRVREEATIVFTRSLYRALACGKSIGNSFRLAKRAVGNSPTVKNARFEMNKFNLLPKNDNHDLVLYLQPRQHPSDDDASSNISRLTASDVSSYLTPHHSNQSSNIILKLPPPPQPFLGRKLEMQQIIQTLPLSESNPRVIQIYGDAGVGKYSLALAVMKYVMDRSPSYCMLDEFYLLPLHYGDALTKDNVLICKKLDELYKMLTLSSELGSSRRNVYNANNFSIQDTCRQIVTHLYHKRALLTIDMRLFHLAKDAELEKNVVDFLHMICHDTKHVRVLLICPAGVDMSTRLPIKTELVRLEGLDMKSSVLLFGHYCKYVGGQQNSIGGSAMRLSDCIKTSIELANVLVPHQQKYQNATITDKNLPPKCGRILALIGGSNPASIQRRAKFMTCQDYIQLIREGLTHLDDKIKWLRHQLKHYDSFTDTSSTTSSSGGGGRDVHAQDHQHDLVEFTELYEEICEKLPLDAANHSLNVASSPPSPPREIQEDPIDFSTPGVIRPTSSSAFSTPDIIQPASDSSPPRREVKLDIVEESDKIEVFSIAKANKDAEKETDVETGLATPAGSKTETTTLAFTSSSSFQHQQTERGVVATQQGSSPEEQPQVAVPNASSRQTRQFQSASSSRRPRRQRKTVKQFLSEHLCLVYVWVIAFAAALSIILVEYVGPGTSEGIGHFWSALIILLAATGVTALVLHIVDVVRARDKNNTSGASNTTGTSMEAGRWNNDHGAVSNSGVAGRSSIDIEMQCIVPGAKQKEVRAWFLLQNEFSDSDKRSLFQLPPDELLLQTPREIEIWIDRVHSAHQRDPETVTMATTPSRNRPPPFDVVSNPSAAAAAFPDSADSSTVSSISSTSARGHLRRDDPMVIREINVYKYYILRDQYLRHHPGGDRQAFDEFFRIKIMERLQQSPEEIDVWLRQVESMWDTNSTNNTEVSSNINDTVVNTTDNNSNNNDSSNADNASLPDTEEAIRGTSVESKRTSTTGSVTPASK